MTKPRLVLASQSPARRRLLKRLGLKFSVKPAHLDEAAVQRRLLDPRKLVRELSRLKAQSVALLEPGAVVIGSDQVLVCDGVIYGKPGTSKRACLQLSRFSGKTIELLTGICVREANGREHLGVHKTKMRFRKLTAQEIRAYVALDQPEQCAGSFKFELHGISLFESITTSDPTAIEGLPLMKLAQILRSLET